MARLRYTRMLSNQSYNPAGVAGDRVTITHGFVDHAGRALTPTQVQCIARAAAADGALTAAQVLPVSWTSTQAIIRGTAKPLTYDMLLVYEADFDDVPG